MKRIQSALSVVVLMFSVLAYAGAEVQVGQPAPDFSLNGNDGQIHKISDHKGEYVVLEWYNKGCPFVKKHYGSGNMQKLQETYIHKGVTWFSIISSAPGKEGYMTKQEVVQNRIDSKIRSTATLMDPDGKVGRLYGAKTTPHMFIIDPKGNLIYMGGIDSNNSPDPADIPNSVNYVALALDQALAGKPVATPSTPPYGCSVKYK